MTEEELRRCCILGGCGCDPDNQQRALAEEMAIAMGDPSKAEEYLKAAAAVLHLYGNGPHKERLKALGLDKGDGKA